MFQILKRHDKGKMPSSVDTGSPLSKPLSAIAVPGMYLFYKYTEFKRQQQESHRKKVTEKELDHLNHKIVGICVCLYTLLYMLVTCGKGVNIRIVRVTQDLHSIFNKYKELNCYIIHI